MILTNGILGQGRGKVGGVVGGTWKGINYVRALVKPANPNTAAQQTQRGKMSDCVEFCKPIVGAIFNAYTDKFQKGMSGFNRFVKDNVGEFDGDIDYPALVMAVGPLFIPAISSVTADSATNNITVAFSTAVGNNGSATDQVFAIAFNVNTGLWGFAAAEVDRSTGTIDVPLGMTAADEIKTWVLAGNYGATSILEMISSASFDASVAADV